MSEIYALMKGSLLIFILGKLGQCLLVFPNITKLPSTKHSYDVHDTKDHSSTVPSPLPFPLHSFRHSRHVGYDPNGDSKSVPDRDGSTISHSATNCNDMQSEAAC